MVMRIPVQRGETHGRVVRGRDELAMGSNMGPYLVLDY